MAEPERESHWSVLGHYLWRAIVAVLTFVVFGLPAVPAYLKSLTNGYSGPGPDVVVFLASALETLLGAPWTPLYQVVLFIACLVFGMWGFAGEIVKRGKTIAALEETLRRPRGNSALDRVRQTMRQEAEYAQQHPVALLSLNPEPRQIEHELGLTMIWNLIVSTHSDRTMEAALILESAPSISEANMIAGSAKVKVIPGRTKPLTCDAVRIVAAKNEMAGDRMFVHYMVNGGWMASGTSGRQEAVVRAEAETGRVHRVALDIDPDNDPPTVTEKDTN